MRFSNNSGEQLLTASTVSSNSDNPSTRAAHTVLDSGEPYEWSLEETETDQITLHISPTDGSKRPQADVQITASNTGDCTTSSVTVLATNTQE